jgi:hypothetical protein
MSFDMDMKHVAFAHLLGMVISQVIFEDFSLLDMDGDYSTWGFSLSHLEGH